MPGLFEQFPHTNLHELNLDWIIDMINQFKTELEDSAVLSVNGETGHVTLYESENVILPPLPEGTDQWRLVRLVNGQYVGILFYNNHAYLQRGNETMRLLTLEDIPSDSGVVSWNGLTGVVNVTGQDIPVDDSADADSIEQAITTEITERTNADNAIRNSITAISDILSNTPQNATQMPMSGSDATTVATAMDTLNSKIERVGIGESVNGSISPNETKTFTFNRTSSALIICEAANLRRQYAGIYIGSASNLVEMFKGSDITVLSNANDEFSITNNSSSGNSYYVVISLEKNITITVN